MTDIQTLQKYENWKSTKKRRKTYIGLIASLTTLPLVLLLTWILLE